MEKLDQLLKQLISLIGAIKVEAANQLPRVALMIGLLLMGYMFSRLMGAIARKLFVKLGGLLMLPRFKARMDVLRIERTADHISKIITWTVLIFFVLAAVETVGVPVFSKWSRGIAQHFPRFLAAILIFIAGFIITLVIRDVAATAAEAAGIQNAGLLANALRFVTLLAVTLIAADRIGINISFLANGLLVILGALLFGAALAFGLGARSQVSNILASHGVQKLYSRGHRIRIGGHEGRIVDITPTVVVLDTGRGRLCLPAKKFVEEESLLMYGETGDES